MLGHTISHYRILAKLGAGGMGEVYRARDERLERDVALKILPPGSLGDEAVRKRFRKEALALSRLNHPNIATIYDFDSQGGTDFLAMECVEGETLAERIAGGALPEKEILSIGGQIAEALEEAHERGIVHRDLKPGNVMVTPKGRVKLLDFGLAKLLRPPSVMTTATVGEAAGAAGTLPYMSPEQLKGEEVDAQSDHFSFGAVLYEMATGRRPFVEETVTGVTDAILHRAPVSPRATNARISPQLEQVILKCLEKEPENRYQSAREIGVDLRRAAGGASVSSGAATALPASTPRRNWPARAGAIAVIVLGSAVAMLTGSWRQRLFGPAAPGQIRSLAVLPLQNFSKDPGQEYFADGMTEALITDLAQIGALRVSSRTSVMQYKGGTKPLPEIAKELHVDAVLEGSVEQAGERVRITAQLIQASSDKHLWAQSYDRDLKDVLTLEDQVAREIAAEIRIQLTPQEQKQLTSGAPTNPEAYRLYLQGRYLWNQGDEESLNRSIACYRQALAIDPNYALAYAGLADSYSSYSDWYRPPREVMPQAEAAARKALELDDSLAAAHVALCSVYAIYEWDWATAERECRQGISLSPNNADAHVDYADYLADVGRFDAAWEEILRAEAIDPVSLHAFGEGAFVNFLARRFDRSIEQGQKGVELDPNFFPGHFWTGLSLALTGQPEEAIAEMQKAAQITDSPLVRAFLGYAYAAAGKKTEARKIAEELITQRPKRYVCPYEIGTIYLQLGDKNEAFRWYETAYQERSICISVLKFDPRLDSIRSDPRYLDILRRVAFPAA